MEKPIKKSGAQKRQAQHELKGDLAYYLTLITIEGHRTWRAFVKPDAQGFDREWATGRHPKVTDRRTFHIDRITGNISQL
jgi:hypothetical protein